MGTVKLKPRVVMLDDDRDAVASFVHEFSDEFDVIGVTAPGEVMARVDDSVAVAVVDERMPGISGIEILRRLRVEKPSITRILLTGYADRDILAAAINEAAVFHYVSKPWEPEKMRQVLRRAAQMHPCPDADGFAALIGENAKFKAVIEQARRIARTDFNVLLLGETGTGKELLAQAIHNGSVRGNQIFHAINCAELEGELARSELFGIEKRVATEVDARIGIFEQSNRGTLFLDEIGELSRETQAMLLRVLDQKKITRVGRQKEIPLDVRIIAATNRDLEKMIEANEFRDDLFFRVSEISIELPPLRERLEDIPLLVQHLLPQVNDKAHKSPPVTSIADEAIRALSLCGYPGNVRELLNELKAAVVQAEGPRIEVQHLSARILSANRTPTKSSKTDSGFKEGRREFQCAQVKGALERARGNRQKAADELEISTRWLSELMGRFGLR